MHQTTTIYTLEQPVNILQLPSTLWESISYDWGGAPLPFAWDFFLGRDEKRLHFFTRSNCSPSKHPTAQCNDFIEGLWNYTVAELFIFAKDTPKYIELNIATNAAWWAAQFSNYREVTKALPNIDLDPLAYYDSNKEYWYAGCSVELPDFINLDTASVSVCGITHLPQETFLCLNPATDSEADFHLKDNAVKLCPKALTKPLDQMV